jgi:ribosomal protein L30/L7E
MTPKTGVMGKVLGGLIERARRIESRVTGTLERASQRLTQSGGRTPLEIAHAIVDVVEARAHLAGRGRRSFTASDIRVTVVAPTRDVRDQYEAVFDGAMPLRDRILERLDSLECGNDDLAVTVSYAAQARLGWVAPDFHVVFHRAESSGARTAADEGPGPVIELRVTNGTAEQPAYFCSQARVDIGRCRDVRDALQRLVRTNHVVFVDSTDPANQSVSRQHAHIACEGPHDVRLYDDGSAHGTSVVRSGRTIPVPPGSRGVRLRSGDGILLGDARLEVGLH